MLNFDHNTMDALINATAGVCMLVSLYGFYLALTYDRARRKR